MSNFILRPIICVLLSFLCISRNGFALTSSKNKAIRNLTPETRSFVQMSEPSYPATRLRLAPAFAVQDQTIGYGGIAELSFSTGAPFYIGVESGYIQWQTDPELPESVAAITIPILASFIYRFELSRSSMHPYLGGALGVVLNRGDANSTNLEAATYEASFQALARPGIEFEFSKTTSFYVEPQFGLLKSQFLFLPQAGLAFSF